MLAASPLKYEVLARMNRSSSVKRAVCAYDTQVLSRVKNWLLTRTRIDPRYTTVLEYFGGLLVVCALDRAYDIHTTPREALDYGHQVMLFVTAGYAIDIFGYLKTITDAHVNERAVMMYDIASFAQYVSSFNQKLVNLDDAQRLEKIAFHHVKYKSNTDNTLKPIFAQLPRRNRGRTDVNAHWNALKRDGMYKEVANALNTARSRRPLR